MAILTLKKSERAKFAASHINAVVSDFVSLRAIVRSLGLEPVNIEVQASDGSIFLDIEIDLLHGKSNQLTNKNVTAHIRGTVDKVSEGPRRLIFKNLVMIDRSYLPMCNIPNITFSLKMNSWTIQSPKSQK